MTASEALLADIADVNRIQKEKGLPLINGDVSGPFLEYSCQEYSDSQKESFKSNLSLFNHLRINARTYHGLISGYN